MVGVEAPDGQASKHFPVLYCLYEAGHEKKKCVSVSFCVRVCVILSICPYLESILMSRLHKCIWEKKDKEYKLNWYVFTKIVLHLDPGSHSSIVAAESCLLLPSQLSSDGHEASPDSAGQLSSCWGLKGSRTEQDLAEVMLGHLQPFSTHCSQPLCRLMLVLGAAIAWVWIITTSDLYLWYDIFSFSKK